MIRATALVLLLAAPAVAQNQPPPDPVDACAALALPDLRRTDRLLRTPPQDRTGGQVARQQTRLQRSRDLAAMLSCLMNTAPDRTTLGRAG